MSNIVDTQLQKYIFASIHGKAFPGHCNVNWNDWKSIDKLIEECKQPSMQICEIGTNTGHSTTLLAIWAKTLAGHLVTMDPMIYPNYAEVQACFRENLRHFQVEQFVEFIRDFSYNVVNRFADGFFDFIFIDGDHSYYEVKKDLELYWPKLKQNGIICGHDCEMLPNKDGFMNIREVRIPAIVKLFTDFEYRKLKGYQTDITVSEDGYFNMREIDDWDKRDIIGLSFTNIPVMGVHPGVCIAVREFFGDKVQIEGEKIWWVRKS